MWRSFFVTIEHGSWLRITTGPLVLVVLLLVGIGCSSEVDRRASARTNPNAASPLNAPVAGSQGMTETMRRQLLAGAIGVLSRLDDFEESAAFAQVFDRLNQWRHATVISEERGSPAALLEGVPEALRKTMDSVVQPAGFDAVDDVTFLRDQRWLADIAAQVIGEGADDLTAATRLFQWTIESLAIIADPPSVPSEESPGSRWYTPGEILLSGMASAPQRAWVFLELMRHAGLDGVMLGTRPGPGEPARPWVPALVSGGECYLFEPTYGIPIPGPDWQGIATARQAASNPDILRQLDVPERAYPVRSQDLQQLVVLVAASTQSFAERMRQLEGDLTGAASMRIAVDARGLAQRALAGLPTGQGEADAPVVLPASIWTFPLETVRRRRESSAVGQALARELAPFSIALVTDEARGAAGGARRPLYVARVREFRNQLDGPDGAKAAYLLARPSKTRIKEIVSMVDPAQQEAVDRVCLRMKENATYWLGLVMAREGQFEAAVDYLDRMTLSGSSNSSWADAARLAAARAYAGLGRIDRAKELLLQDESAQRFGSRISAERLVEPTTTSSQ